MRTWRALAIALSAVDTYYWPFMTHLVSQPVSAWRADRLAFDPPTTLAWLGLSLEQIAALANELRIMASWRDDCGDFYDIIRRSSLKAWESLRGDALSAMDCRLAADILDRFHEEASGVTTAPSGVAFPLDQEGLSSPTHSLDAALTDLQISPFPSLIIGIEGATEYLLVPRVMKLLDIELAPDRIRIIDYGGTDKDLALLARYAAEPCWARR